MSTELDVPEWLVSEEDYRAGKRPARRAPRQRSPGELVTRAVRDRERKDQVRLTAPIIAWDGEGLTVGQGEPQPYVLLGNSQGGRWRAYEGLDTLTCFEALLSTAAENPRARHFVFGGSYDANQWLRDVPEELLRILWAEGAVYWRPFHITYRPRKFFKLRDYSTGRAITVWDAYTWYGSSFLVAVRDWLGMDYPDLPIIAAGKERRSVFTAEELPEIERYMGTELLALVHLVRELIARLNGAEIRVSRFDGPGAAASYLLREHGMRHFKAPPPLSVQRAAAVAYSGGRIELLRYGTHAGTVHHYDIHSAYPAAMVQLPSLVDARWRSYGPDAPLTMLGLYRVRWQARGFNARAPFYPFPFRDQDGSIYYPGNGEGWVWGPELLAYLDHAALFNIEVQVQRAHVLEPADETRPFTWVRELYDERAERKRNGDASEWALKLAINSLYGKTAQTVGWKPDREPPYYSLVWAGLITSITRAALLRAAASNPGAVIMFATDGILATEPLPLELGPALGQWGEETHEGLVAVQSGVYLLREPEGHAPRCTVPGSHWHALTRGYSPRDLVRGEDERPDDRLLSLIREGWQQRADHIGVPQTRFLTLASALQGRAISPHWRGWVTEPRELSLWPEGKRERRATRGRPRPWERLEPTRATELPQVLDGLRSSPYDRAWRGKLDTLINGVRADAYEDELEEATL